VTRALIREIDTARTCLTKKHLRVTGGPVFPEQSPTSPDGELIVGGAKGAAFVAYYTDVSRAEKLEPEVQQSAARDGGQVERHGAATVLFIHHPANKLRDDVLGCAFS